MDWSETLSGAAVATEATVVVAVTGSAATKADGLAKTLTFSESGKLSSVSTCKAMLVPIGNRVLHQDNRQETSLQTNISNI